MISTTRLAMSVTGFYTDRRSSDKVFSRISLILLFMRLRVLMRRGLGERLFELMMLRLR